MWLKKKIKKKHEENKEEPMPEILQSLAAYRLLEKYQHRQRRINRGVFFFTQGTQGPKFEGKRPVD